MDSVKFVPLLVGLLLAVVMVGAVFVPVVESATTKTITAEVEKDNASWLKLGYVTNTDFDFTIQFDDGVTVGSQHGDYGNMIYYSDADKVLFSDTDGAYLVDTDSLEVYHFQNAIRCLSADGSLTVYDGETAIFSGDSPTWAYVPDSNGKFCYFDDGPITLKSNMPEVAIGKYAGVFAYNDVAFVPGNPNDLMVNQYGSYLDGSITWSKYPPNSRSLKSFENEKEVLIDEPSKKLNTLKSAGQHTSGDWTFDLDESNNAIIMSYIGSVTNSVIIPSTVSENGNTYPVTTIGSQVITNSSLDSNGATLVIPEGVTTIKSGAFRYCSKLVGTLELPSTVTKVANLTFQNCNFSGELYIPDSLTDCVGAFQVMPNITSIRFSPNMTTIGASTFNQCTSLTSVIIPDNITSIGSDAFRDCTSLTSLILPEGVSITAGAFRSCTSLDGTLVIPEGVTSTGSNTFNGCAFENLVIVSDSSIGGTNSFSMSSLQEVLALTNNTLNYNTMGINPDIVKNQIDAIGYIGDAYSLEVITVRDDSVTATILSLLPLIAGVGVLLVAVGSMIYTRF